tara:strand:+ start:1560 stop:1943 length:384 start_codon:yes stop_codon:yes gene_type:complete
MSCRNIRNYPQTTGTLAAGTERYCWPFDAAAATNNYARVERFNAITLSCTNTGASNAITGSLIEGCSGNPDTDENWFALATDTLTPAVDATEGDVIERSTHGNPKYLRVTLTSASGTTFAVDATGKG